MNLVRFQDNWWDRMLNGDYGWYNNSVETYKISADKDGNYIYKLTVPGVKKENIDIVVEADYIKISIKYNKDKSQKYTLNMPLGGDTNSVAAKLEDGILSVFIKKLEEYKPRKIKIE